VDNGEIWRIIWNRTTLKEKIMNNDSVMKLSISVTRMITEVLQLLQKMFNKLKNQMQQLPIMMSSKSWKKLSTIEEPQPSKSSAPYIIYLPSFPSAQPSPLSEDDLDDPSPFRQKNHSQTPCHNVTTSPHFISTSQSLCYHHIIVIIICDNRSNKKNGEVSGYP